MSIDLHDLTGAYAADALPASERDAVREHLRACRPCAQEADELTATVALLGLAAAAPPPPALRDRVLAAVSATPQLAPLPARSSTAQPSPTGLTARRTARGLRRRPLQAAACLVALALGFGVNAGLDQRADTSVAASATVGAGPRAGALTITARDLPDPGTGRVYQVWLAQDGALRAGPTFSASRDGAGVTSIPAPNRPTTLMITAEPTGGSARPTSAPLITITVPTT